MRPLRHLVGSSFSRKVREAPSVAPKLSLIGKEKLIRHAAAENTVPDHMSKSRPPVDKRQLTVDRRRLLFNRRPLAGTCRWSPWLRCAPTRGLTAPLSAGRIPLDSERIILSFGGSGFGGEVPLVAKLGSGEIRLAWTGDLQLRGEFSKSVVA